VRRVDWVETSGELGAMLLEAEWIKAQRPFYNRRPQDRAESVTLRFDADHSGRIEARRIDSLEPEELTDCFGVFHCEKDALKALSDIAHARHLCLKVLGQEQSLGSCFASQVGKCKGACVGKEPLILHKARAQLALSPLKIKSWPFPGRIALREQGVRRGDAMREFQVLDHWTYLGSARSEDELAALGSGGTGALFDVDVYKILVRYFSNHPKLDWHDLSAGSNFSRANGLPADFVQQTQ
jgi:DNA polymerase-3 subunit epsilon